MEEWETWNTNRRQLDIWWRNWTGKPWFLQTLPLLTPPLLYTEGKRHSYWRQRRVAHPENTILSCWPHYWQWLRLPSFQWRRCKVWSILATAGHTGQATWKCLALKVNNRNCLGSINFRVKKEWSNFLITSQCSQQLYKGNICLRNYSKISLATLAIGTDQLHVYTIFSHAPMVCSTFNMNYILEGQCQD